MKTTLTVLQAALVLLSACGVNSLGASASHAVLRLEMDGSHVGFSSFFVFVDSLREPGLDSCPSFGGQASLGGLPMEQINKGRFQANLNSNECVAPTFSLNGDGGMPEVKLPVEVVVSDGSTTYAMELVDPLSAPVLTVTEPADGLLHVGQHASVNLSLGHGSLSSIDQRRAGEYPTIVSVRTPEDLVLFEAHPSFGSITVDGGVLGFTLPAQVPPQPAKLVGSGRLALAIGRCAGAVQCEAFHHLNEPLDVGLPHYQGLAVNIVP